MTDILSKRYDGVVILTLNHPDKRNALSAVLLAELSKTLTKLRADDSVRVVILNGAGDAFCSGTDISELASLSEEEARHVSLRGQQLCDNVESFPVPVIAAVNGIAAGGGCELVLACHLRLASSAAKFSLPETKLGLIPAYGGTQRMTRDVAVARALEMMLAGREIDSARALEFGLLNRVVKPEDLMFEALALANEIAALAPLAIRACLKAVREGLKLPLEEGLALERELFASLFATEDAKEGTKAFLEKRAPVFKGR